MLEIGLPLNFFPYKMLATPSCSKKVYLNYNFFVAKVFEKIDIDNVLPSPLLLLSLHPLPKSQQYVFLVTAKKERRSKILIILLWPNILSNDMIHLFQRMSKTI